MLGTCAKASAVVTAVVIPSPTGDYCNYYGNNFYFVFQVTYWYFSFTASMEPRACSWSFILLIGNNYSVLFWFCLVSEIVSGSQADLWLAMLLRLVLNLLRFSRLYFPCYQMDMHQQDWFKIPRFLRNVFRPLHSWYYRSLVLASFLLGVGMLTVTRIVLIKFLWWYWELNPWLYAILGKYCVAES